jgi:hypothetical protein
MSETPASGHRSFSDWRIWGRTRAELIVPSEAVFTSAASSGLIQAGGLPVGDGVRVGMDAKIAQ